jgi:sugar-phosphatase
MATRGADRAAPVWRLDAILFDMDGTLVDSTQSVERQWRRWAPRHGLDPEAFIAVAHGRRTLDTLQELAPQLATEEEAARFDAEEAADDDGVVEVPGAAALIAQLPPDRWAIVTSAQRALAAARLATAGLPVPEVLVSGEDVREGKPHPEGYLLAARRLGVDPARCLVVEDTPAGIGAGLAAGMHVLGITQTYPANTLGLAATAPDLRGVRVSMETDELIVTLGP